MWEELLEEEEGFGVGPGCCSAAGKSARSGMVLPGQPTATYPSTLYLFPQLQTRTVVVLPLSVVKIK